MRKIFVGLMLGIGLLAQPAAAGPVYTFSVSTGSQPSNVGIITLTQNTGTSVIISVDLLDTTLPLPAYGFLNTGGPHTPFAFNVLTPGGSSALSINPFTTPANGTYATGVFSLNTGGGDATPYGTFGITLDSTAGQGSGNAYYGDLLFTLNRATGLDTNQFVTNADGYYFAADLTDGIGNTGSQAWNTRVEGCGTDRVCNQASTGVPEPGTLPLFGMGLLGLLGLAVRRRKYAATS